MALKTGEVVQMSELGKRGRVYLVGAGPGDPGLITVRGRELIERCDVLVYDYLVSDRIRRWTRPGCEMIYVGKQPHFHALPQEEISQLLVSKAAEGLTVVRLKGGDPFVFGRGGEELKVLQDAGVEHEVVPGVTAALAAAAYTGLPLTHREYSSSLCLLTGHENPDKHEMRVDFAQVARMDGTLCIYMGVGQSPRISAQLMEGGMPRATAAVVVEWATTPRQRTFRTTLEGLPATIADNGVHSPALIFIGDATASMAAESWFERRPLFGKRIVVTRASSRAGALAARFTDLGAEVLELPLIATNHDVDPAVAEDIFSEIASYRWIVFTSAHGVNGFFEAFYRKWKDARHFGPMKIACVGSATAAEVARHNFEVDLIPEQAVAEDLVREMVASGDIEHERVLVVTGNRNRDVVAKSLEEAGAIIDLFPVYRTEFVKLGDDPAAADFRQRGADALIFASSSAVESMCSQPEAFKLDSEARRPAFVAFGPITAETLKAKGLPVNLIAPEATADALVSVVVDFLG